MEGSPDLEAVRRTRDATSRLSAKLGIMQTASSSRPTLLEGFPAAQCTSLRHQSPPEWIDLVVTSHFGEPEARSRS